MQRMASELRLAVAREQAERVSAGNAAEEYRRREGRQRSAAEEAAAAAEAARLEQGEVEKTLASLQAEMADNITQCDDLGLELHLAVRQP